MRALRRVLQVVALVGTLMVGIVALALIVSQTPWFRDWLRRYIVRESKQYLNGELSIGRIGGNLLFGVEVSDLAVDVSGERVVAAKTVEVDYNVFQIVSKGVVLNEIKLVEPAIAARAGSERLESRAAGEGAGARRRTGKGRGSRSTLQSIEIVERPGHHRRSCGRRRVRAADDRSRRSNLKASYAYAPVHYSVVIDRAHHARLVA